MSIFLSHSYIYSKIEILYISIFLINTLKTHTHIHTIMNSSSNTTTTTSPRPSTPTTPPPATEWADAGAAPATDWAAVELLTTDQSLPDDSHESTQDSPGSPVVERWTLTKIIGIKGKFVTLVEHESGDLIKARPQSFAQTREDGSRTFVNIDSLNLSVGDFLECCVSNKAWDGWDAHKGGSDIKGWIVECLPQSDLIASAPATLADTPRALELSFKFSATVKSSGEQFSILGNVNSGAAALDGTAFCRDMKVSPRGSLVTGTAFCFSSTNKAGKSTQFIVTSIDSIAIPNVSPNVTSSTRRQRPSNFSASYSMNCGNPLGL